MADVAQLAIEVNSDSVPAATDKLQRLTATAGEAETATGKLARSAQDLASQAEDAATGGMGDLALLVGELAGPLGLAAGIALGKIAMNILEMDSAANKAAASEEKRHEALLADLNQEIQTLREKRRLLTDPNGDSTKVQDTRADLEGKLTQALRDQAAAQQSLNIAKESATGTDRASFSRLSEAGAAYTATTKTVDDLRTKLGDLESQNASAKYQEHAAQVDQFTQSLKKQADQAGKTKAEILRMQEAQLQLTGADKAAADAAIAIIEANEKTAKAHKEQIPLKERLIELLEREVGAQGRITSEAIAYQLSQQDLSASDKARIQALLDQTSATEKLMSAQKEADRVFQDGDRVAKERDELENKLIMDHEKYLETLRKSADPGFFATQDYKKSIDGLNELYDRGVLSVEQYDKAVLKVRADYVRLEAQGDTSLQALVDLTDTAAQKMGQAFGDFAATGKLDFRSLVDSILADFARLEAQKAFEAIASYIVGSFSSSVQSGSSSADAVLSTGNGSDYAGSYAAGPAASYAPASSPPQAALAPAAPEATGARSSVVQQNTITVTINKDGTGGKAEAQGDQQSQDTANKIHAMVRQILIDEQRPGGTLNQRS